MRQRGGIRSPDPDPVVYVPHEQVAVAPRGAVILVRGRSDPGPLTAQLRKEIFALDPDMPLANIRTMDQQLAQQRWDVRVFGTMFTVFAVIAIILATVGLYAVTAYSVTQRTQEIGVRMALGAQASQVRWLILRRGLIQLGDRPDDRPGRCLRCRPAASQPAGANRPDRSGDARRDHAVAGRRRHHRVPLAGAPGHASQPGHGVAVRVGFGLWASGSNLLPEPAAHGPKPAGVPKLEVRSSKVEVLSRKP